MPVVTFDVDLRGMRRQLSVLVDNARVLDEPLRLYGSKYLARKVQQRFDQEGPGWPGRAAGTVSNIIRTGGVLTGGASKRAEGLLRRKLKREVARAQRRADALADFQGAAREERRQATRAAQGKRARSLSDVIRSRATAVARRKAVLTAFEQIVAGREVNAPAKLVEKLNDRLGRAQKKVSGPLLGKIASSFKLRVQGGTLEYGSEIEWAGAHNEGATVGRGAKLPPRPFAYLTEQDLDVLVDMLVAHLGRSVTVE